MKKKGVFLQKNLKFCINGVLYRQESLSKHKQWSGAFLYLNERQDRFLLWQSAK